MKHLLALLLLLPSALLAQDNPSYDPDFDGDGCYSIADILGLLPLFGTCELEWQCGDSTLFDGYWYETVLIGDQCWFAENLRTTTYADGTVIPGSLCDSVWIQTTVGATAVYGEGSSSCNHSSPDIDACDEEQSLAAYGRLYNWYAVDDARGLCPTGWHVPTDEEWTQLEDYLHSQGIYYWEQSQALKSTSGWSNNGTDEIGFSALPGGNRYHETGEFNYAGSSTWWWTSSLGSNDLPLMQFLYGPYLIFVIGTDQIGVSVRCLRDAE